MKPRLIVIDGKTYNSVNEMPEEVRRLYEQARSNFSDQDANRIPDAIEQPRDLSDKNRNGIPDIIENTAGGPIVAKALKVLFDGREYNNLNDLPSDVRARYDQAMGTLDANRNGIPDFMESMTAGAVVQAEDHASRHTGDHTTHHAPRQPMSVTPTIEPDRPNTWLLALLAVFMFVGCVAVAAGVWYFFLR